MVDYYKYYELIRLGYIVSLGERASVNEMTGYYCTVRYNGNLVPCFISIIDNIVVIISNRNKDINFRLDANSVFPNFDSKNK